MTTCYKVYFLFFADKNRSLVQRRFMCFDFNLYLFKSIYEQKKNNLINREKKVNLFGIDVLKRFCSLYIMHRSGLRLFQIMSLP